MVSMFAPARYCPGRFLYEEREQRIRIHSDLSDETIWNLMAQIQQTQVHVHVQVQVTVAYMEPGTGDLDISYVLLDPCKTSHIKIYSSRSENQCEFDSSKT